MAFLRLSAVGPLLLSLGLIGGSWEASANTFAFGTATFRSDLSVDTSFGDSLEQSWSEFHMSTAASANFRGQASADIFSPIPIGDAAADVQLVWDVPYTLTRNVAVAGGMATFPLQTVNFTITFSGAVAVSEFPEELGGGFEGAQIFDHDAVNSPFSVTSLGGLFSTMTFLGDSRAESDGATTVSSSDSDSYDTSVNFPPPAMTAGEVNAAVPVDYREWADFEFPFALDYSQPQVVVQSFTDTLRVSYRLRAESTTPGFFDVTAGEAMACAGLLSTLSFFDLNDTTNCGSGLTIAGAVGQFDTQSMLIPEPSTLLLSLLGLGGLAAFQRRRRS
jgi:hypothetical protein